MSVLVSSRKLPQEEGGEDLSSIGKVKSSGSKSLVSSSEKTRGMMKEKNGKFRSIFDNSDECYIYLSRFGRIQEVNKKAVEIFGGPEE
ncbi:MAG: PAS domain S-box protein, partial [Thermoplasmata archaeon]